MYKHLKYRYILVYATKFRNRIFRTSYFKISIIITLVISSPVFDKEEMLHSPVTLLSFSAVRLTDEVLFKARLAGLAGCDKECVAFVSARATLAKAWLLELPSGLNILSAAKSKALKSISSLRPPPFVPL